MPSVSKAQQAAAGIAHAVEKGEMPKSKLRGASKKMFQSMHGTGELKKFAKTKTKGLPQHTEALTARQMFEREHLTEGRDDAPKLGLGKAGLEYARMSSSDVMDQPGGTAKKVQKRYNMVKSVTNQNKLTGGKPGSKIFPSMDKVGKVPSAIKDSMETKTEKSKPVAEGKWIQKAVDPKHKGYCTPMTKKTCTPRRKALAQRFKKGDLHHEALTPTQVVDAMLND
jgi:hypothetical protein